MAPKLDLEWTIMAQDRSSRVMDIREGSKTMKLIVLLKLLFVLRSVKTIDAFKSCFHSIVHLSTYITILSYQYLVHCLHITSIIMLSPNLLSECKFFYIFETQVVSGWRNTLMYTILLFSAPTPRLNAGLCGRTRIMSPAVAQCGYSNGSGPVDSSRETVNRVRDRYVVLDLYVYINIQAPLQFWERD